jgi:hypothetical protein
MADERNGRAEIGFRQGGLVSAASLQTRYGPMELFLGQTCDGIEGQRERVRLRTIAYKYSIAPAGANDPLFRWEFVRSPSSNSFWCRHHRQGPVDVNIGGRTVNLNDWHLPTGWVPIEEIIRFCIVDLGVSPLDSSVDADGNPDWHGRLSERVENDAA